MPPIPPHTGTKNNHRKYQSFAGIFTISSSPKRYPPGAKGGACCGVTSVTDLNAGVGVGVFWGDLLQGDWSLAPRWMMIFVVGEVGNVCFKGGGN